MRIGHWLWGALAAVLCTSNAQAQRAGENAAAAATDAFGTSVGNESFGLYDPYDARGFSPVQAGNVRIEGLYFDQQSDLGGRVISGNTVHVGISAQSYAFPSPTGIADFSLRIPGDRPLTSVFLGYGVFDGLDLEVDSQMPIVEDRFNLGAGFRVSRFDSSAAVKNFEYEFGSVARIRPNDDTEAIGFYNYVHGECCRQVPNIFPAGDFLPPEFRRHSFWGQPWTGHNWWYENFGALARTGALGDWVIRAGVFRSINDSDGNWGDSLLNTQPNGQGDDVIVGLPPQLFASTSGELRATRTFTDGSLRQTINIALRGRDVERYTGGADSHDLGLVTSGEQLVFPEPKFTFGPTTNDHAKQGTGGVAYDVLWAGVGQAGVGVQKTFYTRDIAQPGVPFETTKSNPVLYNGTLSVFLSKQLALYAGYTRGLEESGTAPTNAANPNQAMPAILTKQVDAGFRYIITPTIKFVAGVFQVDKPYFNLDSHNVYGALGTVRHRGGEFSIAGNLTEDINIVGGLMLLDAKISGDPVDRGIVRPNEPGVSPRYGLLSVTYAPKVWNGLALDAQFYNSAGRPVHSTDDFKSPGWTEVNLGVRYSFKLGNAPAAIRAQLINVASNYGWNVNSSGSFFPRDPRKFLVNFTSDF